METSAQTRSGSSDPEFGTLLGKLADEMPVVVRLTAVAWTVHGIDLQAVPMVEQ